MTASFFNLRHIAYLYCAFLSAHIRFDTYQVGITFGVLAFLTGVALLQRRSGRLAAKQLCRPWLYSFLLIAALLIIRLPTLLPAGLNPDESMFIAGAMKLRHAPVFWESLDGNTSGPLNYYPLTLLNLLGFPLDYATARFLNVLCIGSLIVMVYRLARMFLADWAARLSPLPCLFAAMTFREWNFLHYSSECISAVLIALATWLVLSDGMKERSGWMNGVATGMVLALVPLAKLQAVPIAAVVAAAALGAGYLQHRDNKGRRAIHIVAGGAATMALLLLFLVASGLFSIFLRSYIESNLFYADMSPPMSFSAFLSFCTNEDMEWYEAGIGAYFLFFAVTAFYRWMKRESRKGAPREVLRSAVISSLLCCAGFWWWNSANTITWHQAVIAVFAGVAAGCVRRVIQQPSVLGQLSLSDVLAGLILAASLYAIYRPGRAYPHYLVFLIFPLGLVGMRVLVWSLRLERASSKPNVPDKRAPAQVTAALPTNVLRPAVMFVLVTVAVPCFIRSKEIRSGSASEGWMTGAAAQLTCPACPLIARFAHAGDPVAIWGWASELHVLTGTLPATREPNTPWQLLPGPLRPYYRQRYLSDLERNPPKAFVDAVAPGQFGFQDRGAYGYETFLPLRDYVNANFYLAGDVGGVRVFARRETAGR